MVSNPLPSTYRGGITVERDEPAGSPAEALGGRAAAPRVGILMGSDSDLPTLRETFAVLEELDIPFEATVASAHRTPERVAHYATTASERGLEVLIAAAGSAAHLAGVVAAHTLLPVIGVPLKGGAAGGLDALLATAQMPRGVPVATVALDGAANAALLAARILALKDPQLRRRLEAYRQRMQARVEEADRRLQAELGRATAHLQEASEPPSPSPARPVSQPPSHPQAHPGSEPQPERQPQPRFGGGRATPGGQAVAS